MDVRFTPESGHGGFSVRLFWQLVDDLGLTRPLGASDVNLFGYGERIVHLNAQVTHRTLDLGMPKQQLDRPQVAGSAIDQRGLRSPQRMRAIKGGIEPNDGDPPGDEAGILAR